MLDIQKNKKLIFKTVFNPTPDQIADRSYQYALTSSSLKRFLPHISVDSHKELYQQIVYNQLISAVEQFDENIAEQLKLHNAPDFSSANKKPKIYATFHLGAYRILNNYLIKLGEKVVLIIDDSVYEDQKDQMLYAYEHLKKHTPNQNSDFIILNVKDKSSMHRLRKLIASGYSMVVYLDGNAGLQKEIDFSKRYQQIEFLKQELYVKNGIDFIAKITKTDVTPVMSYRENDTINLKFYDSISFNIKESIVGKCYKYLENLLIKYPTQWECWLYMHKWFVRKKEDYTPPVEKDKNRPLRFNKEVFIPFSRGDNYFLMNRVNYTAYSIPKEHFTIFSKNKVVSEDLEQYISRGVLL